MSEQESKLIDRYLAGALTAPELEDFTKRLAQDPNLQQRLTLRQNLGTFIGSEEDTFRTVLKEEDAHYYKAEATTAPPSLLRYWWWLTLALATGLLCYIVLKATGPGYDNPQFPAEQVITIDTLKQSPAAKTATAPDTARTSPFAPATAPPSQPAKQAPPPAPSPAPKIAAPTAPETKDTTPLYAAVISEDFMPNQQLSALITSSLRGTTDSTSITFNTGTDTIKMAEIASAEILLYSSSRSKLQLTIYDNKEKSFIEELPVIRRAVEPLAGERIKSFLLSSQEIVRPGRYYVLVLNEDDEILASSSFIVMP